MKTKHLVTILIATFAAGWLASAADDTTNTPVEIAPPDAVAAPDAAAPPDAPPDAANAPDVAPDAANAPAPGEPAYAAPANARANARDRRAPGPRRSRKLRRLPFWTRTCRPDRRPPTVLCSTFTKRP